MALEIPSGGIIIWSGAIPNIPFGFVLCDGNNGSPDLRNRFVVGAGDTYFVGKTGGALTHTHGFTSDGHIHQLDAGADIEAGATYKAESDSNTDSGTTDAGTSLPPYYALAFIMKT